MDRYIFFSLSMSLALEILSQKHHSPPFSEKDLCPDSFEIPACVPEMERLPAWWPCHSRHVLCPWPSVGITFKELQEPWLTKPALLLSPFLSDSHSLHMVMDGVVSLL